MFAKLRALEGCHLAIAIERTINSRRTCRQGYCGDRKEGHGQRTDGI
jgi:hypothetical protein